MKSTNEIGFAILGAGMIAEFHARAVVENASRGARLVAIGHYRKERFADIEQSFGVPCMPEEELLADPDVDVLCILYTQRSAQRAGDPGCRGRQARTCRKADGSNHG